MKLKKIYIEITNNCNLSCDFCIKNKRPGKFMSEDEFKNILDKIKNYTNYLYFHILGEPLLHPKINEFIDIASSFNINITTNGYLINRLTNKNVRQLNISLHSYSDNYNIPLDSYMNNIFNAIKDFDNTYISFRFWLYTKYSKQILDFINKNYKTNITLDDIKNNNCIKITDKIFINTFHEFIWPDLDNDYYCESGKCYALKDHIGILVDGTVVPCCLDTKGIINLGNIYKDDLEYILNSKRVINMLDGFKNNKKCEELCKKCNFL